MNKKDELLLEKHGWVVECHSPFEIRTKDGSFATNEAAYIVLDYVKEEEKYNNDVSNNISWIEKDRLAGIKLAEMKAHAVETSMLYECSSKVLRKLIIEGIDIGANIIKD